ncbi:hypothetical protein [Botrimarina mediterranea]|uniref:Uncharacterized protein n=1 Tax=Botrimarina mediterranea TaxID=2528022 RepID=A0A518K7S2_9BACT|nr:hypothetical protein [Botrimarina mediterranea]QDV73830.1 hypothetical protein Spa11_20290 [Botrimarina mediterranea]QDV78459.1 hypothetical protein K2D_20660 [Planctomycetes bacterium K2D]
MKTISQFLSLVAIGGVLAPSMLYFTNVIDLPQVKSLTLIGTVAWFVVAPLWMGLKSTAPSGYQEEA